MKTLLQFVVMMSLSHFMIGCFSENKEHFADDTPLKKMVCALPFPNDLVYQSTPDTSVIIGTKKVSPALFEISGYAMATAQKRWQLPFIGEVVGQTDTHVLVYEEKTSTVHFITPSNGQITRTVSPAPSPLTSKNGMAFGMAFTDELYLTTKALYSQVTENDKTDESFNIGITAKTWENNEQKWFLPPVKQIVSIEYQPVIVGDKVLIINPEVRISEGHSYQIVSLLTGKELYRGTTDGTYYWLDNACFIERTQTFVRRIDPFTQKEVWRMDGDFTNAHVSSIGNQLSIATPSPDKKRTARLINLTAGTLLHQCILPDLDGTRLEAGYVAKDGQLLLHFRKQSFELPGTNEYDYWVNYDLQTQEALWHSDFHSESISSLMPFAADKIEVKK
ncbi:hypothetical protein [Runella sp.]|uniref:hypothetical protein n=1 Tax=Runella sp. TaxID=1960881 RepID=UPI003D14C35D